MERGQLSFAGWSVESRLTGKSPGLIYFSGLEEENPVFKKLSLPGIPVCRVTFNAVVKPCQH